MKRIGPEGRDATTILLSESEVRVRFLSSIKGMIQRREPFRQTINQGRMSFHAYR